MLSRGEVANVKFPVLVNGQRVELNAIRALGQMTSAGTTRPFEHFILAHPRYPISLRIAYGPRGGSFPFKADFSREIVRIDFPVKAAAALSEAFAKNCRVEVPGIYFDFNEATLKAQSVLALQQIAAVLARQPQRHVSIEGHTDNIGSEKYNDDLSAARAAAVKAALVSDFKIDASTISTKGFGLRRPVENNETLAGRARNRRVELVRDCGAGKSTATNFMTPAADPIHMTTIERRAGRIGASVLPPLPFRRRRHAAPPTFGASQANCSMLEARAQAFAVQRSRSLRSAVLRPIRALPSASEPSRRSRGCRYPRRAHLGRTQSNQKNWSG